MSLKKGRCMEKELKCRKKVEVEKLMMSEDSRKSQQKQVTLSVLPLLSPSKARAEG